MGGKLGTIFARAGHDVVFSYARTEQKLNRLAQEANGMLATPIFHGYRYVKGLRYVGNPVVRFTRRVAMAASLDPK
jgi:hypothetical protein